MKKYDNVEIELVLLQAQDVVTMSGFAGDNFDLGNPNSSQENTVGDF